MYTRQQNTIGLSRKYYSMVKWITGIDAHKKLLTLSTGSAFAIRSQKSYGTAKRYLTVEDGPYRDRKNYHDSSMGEPYDITVDCSMSNTPKREYMDSVSIAYDPSNKQLYLRKMVGQFEPLTGVSFDPLSVDYDMDVNMIVECDYCGQRYRQPVSEDDLPMKGQSLVTDNDGELVTPCCRTESWTSRLDK